MYSLIWVVDIWDFYLKISNNQKIPVKMRIFKLLLATEDSVSKTHQNFQ